MILKHKNMRDVAAQVWKKQGVNSYLVCWVNLLGTYEHPHPFLMGKGSQLALETITIKDMGDWQTFETLEDAKENRKEQSK